MKKILISNIGNRNLKIDGKFISKIFDSDENSSFREQTRLIAEQLKAGTLVSKPEPVIINEVIEKEKDQLEKVYLISSDMPDKLRNDQDTVFEGEILCHILKEIYPDIIFENIPFQASVFVHDELFPSYRNFLLKIKKQESGKHIIYCDAGGTSQQKFAAKISLEYLFEPTQFTVYYVAQEQKGQSKVIRGESYEYRKIIDLEHAIQAIHSAAYPLAKNLLIANGYQPSGIECGLLEFIELRSRFLIKETRKKADALIREKQCTQSVINYSRNISFGKFEGWEKLLTPTDFFQLSEILAIVQWKYSVGVIEQSVHFFSMFIENYIHCVLKNQFQYDFGTQYEDAYSNFLTDYSNGRFTFPDYIDPNKRGLPPLIELTSQIKHSKNIQICDCLKKINSRNARKNVGIDTLRNNYAHKGLGVKAQSLKDRGFVDEIEKCFVLFNMDFRRNYYEEMHFEITEMLR